MTTSDDERLENHRAPDKAALPGGVLENYAEAEIKYFHCLKAGILAHVQGHAPAVSVEYARKCLFAHDRPSFADIEEAVASVQAA